MCLAFHVSLSQHCTIKASCFKRTKLKFFCCCRSHTPGEAILFCTRECDGHSSCGSASATSFGQQWAVHRDPCRNGPCRLRRACAEASALFLGCSQRCCIGRVSCADENCWMCLAFCETTVLSPQSKVQRVAAPTLACLPSSCRTASVAPERKMATGRQCTDAHWTFYLNIGDSFHTLSEIHFPDFEFAKRNETTWCLDHLDLIQILDRPRKLDFLLAKSMLGGRPCMTRFEQQSPCYQWNVLQTTCFCICPGCGMHGALSVPSIVVAWQQIYRSQCLELVFEQMAAFLPSLPGASWLLLMLVGWWSLWKRFCSMDFPSTEWEYHLASRRDSWRAWVGTRCMFMLWGRRFCWPLGWLIGACLLQTSLALHRQCGVQALHFRVRSPKSTAQQSARERTRFRQDPGRSRFARREVEIWQQKQQIDWKPAGAYMPALERNSPNESVAQKRQGKP